MLVPGWAVSFGCRGFAECWSFEDVEAPLGNHSAQSAAGVRVVSPEHAMGHCKVKCGLYSAQKVLWRLNWLLQPGWAGGLWGVRFC